VGTEASTTASSAIRLKRAYESPEEGDGIRVLVDRLWARGVSKEAAKLDAWMKELGPTVELRKWFGHRPERWEEFVEKYRFELATPLRQLLLTELQEVVVGSTLTLVYGARDTNENEAVVLRHYLLHERARSEHTWEATDTILVTATVLAAAHHDAAAPASSLKLFASGFLTEQEIDGALNDLVNSGTLCQSSGGWRVMPRGLLRIQKLSNRGTTKGA
jgi:uncharacterized protein YeaO (DUF488 family)